MKTRAFGLLALPELTPAQEASLEQELTRAYHMDEAAIASRQVQRLAERVKARMDSGDGKRAGTDLAPRP